MTLTGGGHVFVFRVQDEGTRRPLEQAARKGCVDKHLNFGQRAYVVGATMNPDKRDIERFDAVRPFPAATWHKEPAE